MFFYMLSSYCCNYTSYVLLHANFMMLQLYHLCYCMLLQVYHLSSSTGLLHAVAPIPPLFFYRLTSYCCNSTSATLPPMFFYRLTSYCCNYSIYVLLQAYCMLLQLYHLCFLQAYFILLHIYHLCSSTCLLHTVATIPPMFFYMLTS